MADGIVPASQVKPEWTGAGPRSSEAGAPLRRPWTLPACGLAVFHGAAETARLSHYFLPYLLRQGKRVLMLDGANCADPRLLERLARQRGVPFAEFNQQIEIARAFTCFQLTELIMRVPRLLADFPAQVLVVTAFPELYYDEDVQDWNARGAFERALASLRRWSSPFTLSPLLPGEGRRNLLVNSRPLPLGEGAPPEAGRVRESVSPPLTIALFSSAATFVPSPARRRFFERTCAAAVEVWRFEVGADNRLRLVCTRSAPRLGEMASDE